MLFTKNAIIKHLKMKRSRILDFIDTVHVENRVAIGYSRDEIDGISGDILLLIIDAGKRISNLEKENRRHPPKYFQKLRRGLALLKSFYEQPTPRTEIGTVNDLESYLEYEWNYMTPPEGNSPIPAQASTIGINTGNILPH